MNLARNPGILDFLEYVLQDEPILFGSLNFEKGTQQAIHVDAIFFWPEPYYAMVGVWVALEDVDMENGPLMYVPGSHKWEMIRAEDIVEGNPALLNEREKARAGNFISSAERADLVSRMGNQWTEKFIRIMEEKRVEPVQVAMKRGDVAVWHSLLAHGGSMIVDKARSRKSVVYHYLGKNSLLFSFENFMLLNRDEFRKNNSEKISSKHYEGMDYISYPYFVTYNEGQQEVHNLEG